VALISTPDDTFLYNTSMTVDISNNNISSFSGTCYFDTVTFSNIILPSNLGYIYDFQLNIKYNITPNEVYVQNYKIPTIISYFNASTPSTPSLTNCIISGNHSITSPSLTITGEPRQ
jgi:hypothetical protein